MIGTCLSGITVHKPTSIGDAIAILREHGDDAAILAGGTDLLVDLRVQRRNEHHLVSLSDITELRGISESSDAIFIGAATTLTDLLSSDCVHVHFPALLEAASAIGSYQIRNTATVGGNVASGVPCADLPPVFMVLHADIVIASHDGERSVPIDRFFKNVRTTCMRQGELLRGIEIPKQEAKSTSTFERFDLRQGNSLAVASAACALSMNGDTINSATIALGAVAPVPTLVPNVDSLLAGKPCTEQSIADAAEIAMNAALPISDLRSSAEYRRELVGILTTRAIKRAVEQCS